MHVLLGFEVFLLGQCVLLSVEHPKPSRTLNEWMKHLLGNYYAKPRYYYFVRGRRASGAIHTKTTNLSILEIVEHFVSIFIILISNNNRNFINGIDHICGGTKAKAAITHNSKPNCGCSCNVLVIQQVGYACTSSTKVGRNNRIYPSVVRHFE